MIEINNLTLYFGKNIALSNINAHIKQNSLTAIVGPNGGGKSTLLKVILGLLKSNIGYIKLNTTSDKIAYLPQSTNLDKDFPIIVEDTVCMGFWQKNGTFRALQNDQKLQLDKILDLLNLNKLRKAPISTLSGGELQKTIFARIVLQNAELILLDEPFVAIDAGVTRELLNLIQNWHKEGKTIIAVMHDLEQVKKYFPETLLISKTKIAHGKTLDVLNETNLAKALQNSLNTSFREENV